MVDKAADGVDELMGHRASASPAFLTSIHPSGDPSTILSADEQTHQRLGDVVVLSMNSMQFLGRQKREARIKHAVSALAPNGILWVDVPGPRRPGVMRALRASGFVVGVSTVHRTRGAARIDFALNSCSLRFALTNGHVSRRWRLVLTLLERVPGGRAVLFRFLPNLGFAAYRIGTKPFSWLLDRLPTTDDASVVLKTSWRGAQAPFLVFGLTKAAAVVAKRGDPAYHTAIEHEAAILKLFQPSLANAGLDFPRLIDCHRTPRLHSLIESEVRGRPMSSWIGAGRHRDLGVIADQLGAWLSRWNSQTVRHVELTPALSELLILSAARQLVGSIEDGTKYLEWLSAKTERLIGQKVPLVAAHNDLTMANVLGDLSGICSVVDWEAASPDGLPLADFRYAACDAAAAIAGGDRLAAFQVCFVDAGEPCQRLRQSEARLRAIVGGPPEWLELCTQAVWLQHAANEVIRSPMSGTGPFVAIANLLAKHAHNR